MSQNTEKKLLRIGELAKLAGVNTSSINYWTTMGILKPSSSTKKGYRLYPAETLVAIKRLRKLQEAKKKGTLQQIKQRFDREDNR